MRWLGISRPEVIGVGGERYHENVQGEPAEVEGTVGEWVVDPATLGRDFDGRTALLSPFDRLIHDRVRAQELFDFDVLPSRCTSRRTSDAGGTSRSRSSTRTGWSASSTPSPTGRRRLLRVHAIHEDVRFTRALTRAVRAELDGLASWLGLEDVVLPNS